MNKKIIYAAPSSSSPYHLDTINNLKSKYNWEPVIINSPSSIVDLARKKFPEAWVSDSMKIRQAQFDNIVKKDLVPLETDLINNVKKFETKYFLTLEDASGWDYSFEERKENFYDIIKYWNSIIKKFQPNIFIGFNWPHVSSDYSLYLLSKYYYKLPTIFINPIPLFNKSYYSFGTSLENSSETFIKDYNSNESDKTSFIVKEYLKNFDKNPSEPIYQNKYYNRLRTKKNYSFFQLIYFLFTGKIFKKLNLAIKKNKTIAKSEKSRISILDHIFLINKKKKLNKKNIFFYEKNSVKFIDDENYIYYPAQYFPEPNSGIMLNTYQDQFLILEMLNKALPNNWKIYYKEHPETFLSLRLSSPFKNEEYFKKLKKLDKIILISQKVNSLKLIKSAKATVGLGTAGWESLILGKPCLIFDNIWYSACKSVIKIKSIDDIKNAIKKINNNYSVDPNDIKKYAQSVYLSSFETSIYSDTLEYLKVDKIQIKKNYLKLADEFVKFYNKFF
tara:strand:- start:5449 stop:6957 length:1509 start_codon:yes stop_codon:yes gene_type:complete